MGFDVFDGEKKVADLVTRMFGEMSAAKAKRAEAALVAANPELKNIRTMAAGTILVTPTVPGISVTAASDDAVIPPLEPVRSALESLIQEIAEAARQERTEIDETVKFVKSPEMKRAVAELPDVSPYLEQAMKGLDQRSTDNNGAELLVKQLQAALKNVEGLSARLAKL